jgi:stage VI sporulation protein D
LIGQESKVTMKFRIVQEEDSLPDLAELYQTSVNDLVRVNNLQRQEVDRGQILYIPTRRR